MGEVPRRLPESMREEISVSDRLFKKNKLHCELQRFLSSANDRLWTRNGVLLLCRRKFGYIIGGLIIIFIIFNVMSKNRFTSAKLTSDNIISIELLSRRDQKFFSSLSIDEIYELIRADFEQSGINQFYKIKLSKKIESMNIEPKKYADDIIFYTIDKNSVNCYQILISKPSFLDNIFHPQKHPYSCKFIESIPLVDL